MASKLQRSQRTRRQLRELRDAGALSTMMGHVMRVVWLLLFLSGTKAIEDKTCVWDGSNECAPPSSLESMTVDVGHGNETAWVYMSPDVSTFYQESPGSRKLKQPSFNGMFGKFVNLSPDPVRVFWDAGRNKDKVYISDMAGFEASATATYPTHVFHVTPRDDSEKILTTFRITPDQSIYVYDPLQDPVAELNEEQLQMYTLQKESLAFGEAYKEKTGRDWLVLYRKRNRPKYHMWDADYFGQEHVVTTTETHFHSVPPDDQLTKIRPGEQRRLQDYRVADETLNLTLKVVSCEPRVFEIENFLSETEVNHFLELTTTMKLRLSTTSAGAGAEARPDKTTRTSTNTWVPRERTPIIDALYRRAADVLQIDESLLRKSAPGEQRPPDAPQGAICERLQLVHYAVGERYTAHHDFSVPPAQSEGQPARFATILFYLNEGMDGGETSFPKYRNADTRDALKVTPKTGKAILFYSALPDGNMDELSQHAALPVTKHEKWITNLWVWNPYMDITGYV